MVVWCPYGVTMRFPPNNAVTIVLSASVVLLCVWLIFVAVRKAPIDRRISIIASSRTGRWMAAGTSQGLVTVLDGRSGTAAWQANFPDGPLNDLRFSPDERSLAVAGMDLGLYSLQHSAEPRSLRSDARNYGVVRFSADGTAILVITGPGLIEVLDAQSGATRLSIAAPVYTAKLRLLPASEASSTRVIGRGAGTRARGSFWQG